MRAVVLPPSGATLLVAGATGGVGRLGEHAVAVG